MVSKPQELVDRIRYGDAEARLKALREVKNQIIGNKHRKLRYIALGAVPHIIQLLKSTADGNTLVQSATAVGSFAYGTDDGVTAIIEAQGVESLLTALSNGDDNVVEAAVRSLKLIYKSPLAPHGPLLAPETLQQLVNLLQSARGNLPAVVATILARCCQTSAERDVVVSSGAVRHLVPLLVVDRPTTQEAALLALGTITKDNAQACSQLMEGGEKVLSQLLQLTRSPRNSLRLTACMCLTHISRCLTSPTYSLPQLQHVQRLILPVLVKLLAEPQVNEEVPGVLAELVETSEELQKAAADADAVRLLSSFLRSSSYNPQQRLGVLTAMGRLSLTQHRARQQLMEARVVPLVAADLTDKDEGLRAAATLCVRAMSRCVKTLRSSLMEADLARPLCELLDQDSEAVLDHAVAAISNLVLDFSSLKTEMLKNQVVNRLVRLSTSGSPSLKINCVWALKNLAYEAQSSVKQQVVEELKWADVRAWVLEGEEALQEQALGLLRNTCKGASADIDLVVQWSGGEIISILEDKLDPSRPSSPSIISQCLFLMTNIAAGHACHKDLIVSCNLPYLLAHHMRERAEQQVLLPAVWCVQNLLWPETEAGQGSRRKKLTDLGVEDRLKVMQSDECQDVRERAKTVLDVWQKVE